MTSRLVALCFDANDPRRLVAFWADGRHFVNNVSKEFYVGPSRGQRQFVQFVPTLTEKQIEMYARKAGLGAEAPA